jgi:hypothetical protein
MWKSENEMQAVVRFVWYEWEMFSWGMDVIRSTLLVGRDPDDWNVGTGDQGETKDALIEVTLMHARELRDFLGRDRKELKAFEQTDIVAGDFFDHPGEWVPHRIPSISPKAERERLNRSLVHLAYDRTHYEMAGKEWDFKLVFSEITAAWNAFLAALPDGRKKWFGEERNQRPARRGRPCFPA